MEEDIYIELIYKELQSALTDEEQTKLRNWEQSSEENTQSAKVIRDTWHLSEGYQPDFEADLDKEYKAFQKNLVGTSAKKVQLGGLKNWMKYAAIALVLIGVGSTIAYFVSAPGEYVVSDVKAEKTETIKLADKSVVTLREGATLRYPNRFEGDTREVGLFGEAFFDITKNRKPFVINIEHGQIEVVGTAFNVKTHWNELFTLKVKEGTVKFTSQVGEQETLNGGETLVYYIRNKSFIKIPMNTTNMDSWISNTLTFDGARLQDAVVDLNEHYNANIQIEVDELANCPFTGTFTNKPLDEILETLRAVFQLDGIDQFDTIIALRGGTCPNQ